jgi:uncharacterized protein
MSLVGTIQEIRRYPVKSMQGESLTSAGLTELGIHGDRAYAVRDLETNKILSAKVPKVGAVLLTCRAQTVQTSGSDSSKVIVTVNGSEYDVNDPNLNVVLGDMLGRTVRVERATTADEIYESYWPAMEGVALSDVTIDLPIAMSTPKGTFSDLAALHLLSLNSVEHLRSLNSDLELSVERFRPSIVVNTGSVAGSVTGFAEKQWVDKPATVGGATIQFGAESPRCVMTTLAQGDLPRQPSVLQTIANNNRVEFGGFGNFACLGIYAEVSMSGLITVGDELHL